MDWQQITALTLVALTAALLARAQIRRSRRGVLSSCGECRCGTALQPHGENSTTEKVK